MKWSQREPKIKPHSSDDIISQLAKIRGVKDLPTFLNPPRKVLNDPYLLNNIVQVASAIIGAIYDNQRICVCADVDSDGLFSTAAFVRYIRQFTDNYYIAYHERSAGHGLENDLENIEPDTKLVVAIDSSTNSTKACKQLTELGMKVVIIDHHVFEEDNPYAVIVNPQLDDYPNKEISGSGLIYKLLQVMDNTLDGLNPDALIDLVGCGIYADIMSVAVLENRYMIINGMKNIRNTGIKAILDLSGVSVNDVNSQTIGFTISPLINGVARLDKLSLALELLLEDDYIRCVELVKEMKKLNEERKSIQDKLFKAYLSQVDENDKIIIAVDEQASKGFNGLVANKLAEHFQRPAIVMRSHEGSLAGSYRSFNNFPVKSFLNEIKLVNYALGHEGAGGIGFKEHNLEKFKRIVNDKLKGLDFVVKYEYDLELDVDDITISLIEQINDFNYLTGKDFPIATFKVINLIVEEDRKVLGSNNDTVKIICDGLTLIKFKVTDEYAEDIKPMDRIEVVGALNINEWFNQYSRKNVVTCQLYLDGYHKITRKKRGA